MRPPHRSTALRPAWLLAGAAALAATSACAAGAPTALDEAGDETGLYEPLEALPDEAKEDGIRAPGPRVAAGVDTEVWAVRNAWADRDTAEARKAGLAWGANSGLTWEQKFERWVGSLRKVPRADGGSGETFEITTPEGRTVPAPVLECAETALFLRVTFASWYGLPFYLTGWDAAGRQALYAGHFGFVNKAGQRIGTFPRFRTAYTDHSRTWRAGTAWPKDARLRGLRLAGDDTVPWLASATTTPGAGAYFDEMFLNKRVGYFMRLILLYFGSVNLADSANTLHARPASIRPGDVLLERWQARGIGHTLVVLAVGGRPAPGELSVELASGSMPRRQPRWDDGLASRRYLVDARTGGEGVTADGTRYAQLGGGLRRFRAPVLRAGVWTNELPPGSEESWVDPRDLDAIAARPAEFDALLASGSPEAQRASALRRIETARAHLRSFPASCSARTAREDAFAQLYAVESSYFGRTRAEVDATHRTLEDWVFGELEYSQSRTCCWNSTTAAMSEIVLDYARSTLAAAAARGECIEPPVFRSEATAGGDGYAAFRAHAERLGRGAEWRAWSEDEPCAQRAVAVDARTARGPAPYCAVRGGLGSGAAASPACDAAPDDLRAVAPALAVGASRAGRICAGDVDYLRIDAARATVVTLRFAHASGDLDLDLEDATGAVVASSTGVGNDERVTTPGAGTFYARIYGYGRAANDYTVRAD
jgi:hypothetical protein